MSILTIGDILAGKQLSRVAPINIDGLGMLELHELTYYESNKLQKEIIEAEEKGAAVVEDVVLKWVGRLMKGEFLSEIDLELIREKMPKGIIKNIYFSGLSFEPETQEQIEKN